VVSLGLCALARRAGLPLRVAWDRWRDTLEVDPVWKGSAIVALARSVQQYRPVARNDAELVARLRALAAAHRRYGCPRLHAMLRLEGLVLNHKQTERLYRAEGLQVRTKKRRKLPRRDRIAPQVPERPMQ
jgi:putative transposase